MLTERQLVTLAEEETGLALLVLVLVVAPLALLAIVPVLPVVPVVPVFAILAMLPVLAIAIAAVLLVAPLELPVCAEYEVGASSTIIEVRYILTR